MLFVQKRCSLSRWINVEWLNYLLNCVLIKWWWNKKREKKMMRWRKQEDEDDNKVIEKQILKWWIRVCTEFVYYYDVHSIRNHIDDDRDDDDDDHDEKQSKMKRKREKAEASISYHEWRNHHPSCLRERERERKW